MAQTTALLLACHDHPDLELSTQVQRSIDGANLTIQFVVQDVINAPFRASATGSSDDLQATGELRSRVDDDAGRAKAWGAILSVPGRRTVRVVPVDANVRQAPSLA